MNETIKVIQNHASVRNFEDTPLSQEVKDTLISAACSGASSNFIQAFSIVEITDEDMRRELAAITNSAAYVNKTGAFYVFVADLYRQASLLQKAGKSLAPIQNMEALIVSVVDATIGAQNMALAAESLGLGICYIGGIRNNIEKVADILQLPPYTVPLYGLTIGIPLSKNECKPRLLRQNQVCTNTYNKEIFAELEAYDQVTKAYYLERGVNAQDSSWIQKNIDFFSSPRREEVGPFLKKQGFTLE